MSPEKSPEVIRAKRALQKYIEANKSYVLSTDGSFGPEDVDMLKYMKEQSFDLTIVSSAIRELTKE